jgi:hypothetical protein
MIPAVVERRARWVLDSIGATELGFGDDLPYDAAAWEQIDRGERPLGDELADGFFHLARVEERNGPRDEHGRFRAEWSCLDPLDPPLERLRRKLGVATPDDRPRFTIALTHDVDTPWRWTRIGLRGAAARLKQNVRHARLGPAVRETTGLATVPLHRLRGTDPNWRFEQILAEERRRGATGSTFYVMPSRPARRSRAGGIQPPPATARRDAARRRCGGRPARQLRRSRRSDSPHCGEAKARVARRPDRRPPLSLPSRGSAPKPRAARGRRSPLRHDARLP